MDPEEDLCWSRYSEVSACAFSDAAHFFPVVFSPQETHLNFRLFTWLSPNATGREFYKVLENSVVWKFHRTTFLKICWGLFIILPSGPRLQSLSLTRERNFLAGSLPLAVIKAFWIGAKTHLSYFEFLLCKTWVLKSLLCTWCCQSHGMMGSMDFRREPFHR